eukprot:Skav227441  [mRNA]  locus=scaffold2491:38957:40472:+ [translate_table: standard]
MASTCTQKQHRGYGCRVIQRLIEYCASVQISALLDEVLQCCGLALGHGAGHGPVWELRALAAPSRERGFGCWPMAGPGHWEPSHKYASNVIEKALQCATPDERAQLVEAEM